MASQAVKWVKGPREVVQSTDPKGNVTVRRGKRGGPIVEQNVVKVLVLR